MAGLTRMALHLDFVNPKRPPAAAGWLLLVVAVLVVAAGVTWYLLVLAPDLQAAERRLQAATQALAATQPPSLAIGGTELAAERDRAGRLSQRLAVRWDQLFGILETTAEQPIALLSLEPDADKQELVLTGEARNFAALMAYYQFLQQQRILRDVVLQTHQVNRQDRDKPVRFRIVAEWESAP
jgi:Tfp pilus assembly protein PilN